MITKGAMQSYLTDMVLNETKAFIEMRIREEGEKILMEAAANVMAGLQFTIREDMISDRLIMTMEVKKK